MESLEFHQFYCSILEQLTQLLLKGPFDPQIILYLVATRQEAMPLTQLLSNIRYFELKKPKTGMPKRQMLSICQKEGYSVAELTDIQNELR